MVASANEILRVWEKTEVAHLWASNEKQNWCIIPLKVQRVVLTGEMNVPVRKPRSPDDRGMGLLVSAENGSGHNDLWTVFPGDEGLLCINGSFVVMATGMQVLRDRDELCVGQGPGQEPDGLEVGGKVRLYFSTESLAQVVPFPGHSHRIICPRCMQEIQKNFPAVQCPGAGCSRWYHQGGKLTCWTYSETCAHCPQNTSLEAAYKFTPEEEL